MNTTHHLPVWPMPGRFPGRWLRHIAAAWRRAGADTRFGQAARADHRVLADCLHAAGRDLDDAAGLAQSWGRFPEQLPDGRGTATHLRHC